MPLKRKYYAFDCGNKTGLLCFVFVSALYESNVFIVGANMLIMRDVKYKRGELDALFRILFQHIHPLQHSEMLKKTYTGWNPVAQLTI